MATDERASSNRAGGLVVVVVLVMGLLVSAAAAPALDLSGLTHLDGSEVLPGELSDDVILIFFSTWSPKCRDIDIRVKKINRQWGQTAPVFLIDFQEDARAVEKFFEGKSLDVEVLLDPGATFSKGQKITYLPSLLAVKDGSTAFRGRLPNDVASVLRPIYE